MKPAAVIVAALAVIGVGFFGGAHIKDELDRKAAEDAAHQAELVRLAEIERQRREEEERLRRIEAAWSARLALARSHAQTIKLNGAAISCDLESNAAKPARTTGNADADLLLTVAEQPLVAFIVHGFEISMNNGVRPQAAMRTEFAAHADILRDQAGPSAICYVSWRSFDGFGDHQTFLGDTVAAVRQLSQDAIARREGDSRRIILVGYSTGANFTKHAAIHALDAHANTASPTMGERHTTLRVVALGAPHFGAPNTRSWLNMSRGAMALVGILSVFSGNERGVQNASAAMRGIDELEATRGMRQLQPNSPDLAALNQRTRQRMGQFEFVNLWSYTDDVVHYTSSRWEGSIEGGFQDMRHNAWPRPAPGSQYHQVLTAAYAERVS